MHSSTPVITTTMIPRSLRSKLRTLPKLSERYPEIRSVTLRWEAHHKGSVLKAKTWLLRRNLRALLTLSCPCRGCLDGGFDLAEALSQAVVARKHEAKYQLSCSGWRSGTDSFRLQRCPCSLQVELEIKYEPTN